MKRALTILAAFVALAGCTIEEAEYFDPTQNGFRMFRTMNYWFSNETATAAQIMLFDLYYSAPEEERETIHDRYFYSSRIVGSGNEWCIIDNFRKLVIYTDGQPLSTDGATWKYVCSFQNYSDNDMPTIVCRTGDSGPVYDFRLPNGGGELSFTADYCSQPQSNGTTLYWCELQITGSGECPADRDYDEFGKIAYEIAEPLKYRSNRPYQFDSGRLKLSTQTDEGPLEAQAEYLGEDYVSVASGAYSNHYRY